MEGSAAKQQSMAGGSMATAEQAYLRTELEQRRVRLVPLGWCGFCGAEHDKCLGAQRRVAVRVEPGLPRTATRIVETLLVIPFEHSDG